MDPSSTYSLHAAICARFYDLTVNADEAARFVYRNSQSSKGERGIFVGSMFEIARRLFDAGIELTVVDYSPEMVEVGRTKLPGVRVEQADLRALPVSPVSDLVFVVGRVFTHMITDTDLNCALSSCRAALRVGGRLFFDCYEDTKIQRTSYFNGTIEAAEGDTLIRRSSSTLKVSDEPFVVRWSAEYTGKLAGIPFAFSDTMEHRAFSRKEIGDLLPAYGFKVLAQGSNFDETSFYTLAQVV